MEGRFSRIDRGGIEGVRCLQDPKTLGIEEEKKVEKGESKE